MLSFRTVSKSCRIIISPQHGRCHHLALSTSANAKTEERIVIPKRIQRKPTDILYALSATVGTDSTAAHYKYHDDPYLIPMSNVSKRTFAMAQEAGRKAAKWIRQEHAFLFQHANADPPIKAYMPTLVYTEDSSVTLDSLTETLANVEVADSVLVYKKLIADGVEVPAEMKQQLLELVGFFNHEDTVSDELIEERWHSQSSVGKERQRKTWKDHDLAEQLFAEIQPPTAQSYSAIIRGMAKYFQVERAWALFQEALEKDLALDTATFNSIIQVANFLKESGDMRWELVQDILRTMATRQVQPDVNTLNSVLAVISTIGGYRNNRNYALQTLAEFKALNIEPSLAAWYYILAIFCRDRGPISHVLVDILNQIEGKEFQIRNAKDTFFFVTAMDVCRNHLADKELGRRVDKLLHHGNNYDLIGDSYKESIYYRHYFGLLCSTEPLEVFMETYNRLVPHIYTPEPGIMSEILKQVEVNGALDHLPRLWSDMVIFDHINRESLLEQVLKIIVENSPNPELPAQVGLDEKFLNIAWQIWQKIEHQQEGRTNLMTWTGRMLGDVLEICCRSSDFEKANDVFNKLDKDAHKVSGIPSEKSIESFVRLCIADKQPSRSIAGLQYSVENGLQSSKMLARIISQELTLDETHVSKIKSLVGNDVLQP